MILHTNSPARQAVLASVGLLIVLNGGIFLYFRHIELPLTYFTPLFVLLWFCVIWFGCLYFSKRNYWKIGILIRCGIPVVMLTLATWYFVGVGYARWIEKHTTSYALSFRTETVRAEDCEKLKFTIAQGIASREECLEAVLPFEVQLSTEIDDNKVVIKKGRDTIREVPLEATEGYVRTTIEGNKLIIRKGDHVQEILIED